MPETPAGRGRRAKANAAKNRSKAKFPNIEIKDDADSIGNNQEKTEELMRRHEVARQTPESPENTDTEDDVKDNEALDPEDKLVICLVSCLTECSRQRLRSLHMSLRHHGNVDSRVTVKDFQSALQANQIKLTQRVLQMITEIFEDSRGIDYERLYQCMARAHLRTGRDSIKASNKRNDLKRRQEKIIEEIDNDFLKRLEEQLVKERTYFDMDVLRSEFCKYDHQGVGKMNKEGVYFICCEKTPLYGALLKNLINRCDEDKDNKISWPLLLSFLDNAQKSVWEKNPELASLPQKGREKASVRISTPEPIDQMSPSAKCKVVNKLLKKNPSSADVTSDLPEFKLLSLHRQVVAKTSEDEEHKDVTFQEYQTLSNVNETLTNVNETLTNVDEIQKPLGQAHKAGGIDTSTRTRIASEISKKLTSHKLFSHKLTSQAEGAALTGVADEISQEDTDHKGDQLEGKVAGKLHSSSSTTSVLGHVQNLAEVPDILKQDTANITQRDVNDITQQVVSDITQGDVKDITQRDVNDNTQHVVSGSKPDVASLPQDMIASEIAETQQPGLQLEWIYGYCNHHGSCNLGLLTSGDIIYFLASNIIIYNRKRHQQRHYREHTDNVRCLTVHSDGILAASGQSASLSDQKNKAHVRVWRTDTLQTLHVLADEDVFRQSVDSLSFMPARNILVAVSDCPETKLSVWETQEGALLAQTTVSAQVLHHLEFNPWISESLVTCGTEHLVWWVISGETGEIKLSSQPNYEMYVKAHVYTCLCHNQRGDVVSGDSSGSIYIWANKGASILNVIKHGHQGPVTDLALLYNHLLSSGKDGSINSWSTGKIMEKESSLQLPRSEGGVRSMLLLPGVKGSVLVAGTTTNSLIQVTLNQHKSPLEDVALENVPITQGHTEDLRAIRTIPQSLFGADIISASTDGLICKLNSKSREAVWKLWMKDYPFVSVDTCPEGDQIFLGTQDGKLVILRVIKEDMTVVEIFNQKISTGAVRHVSLSPDGNMVAAASTTGQVNIYSCWGNSLADGTEMWTFAGKFKGRTSDLDSIDWSTAGSEDGYLMRTSRCLQNQQLWKVPSCVEVKADRTTSSTIGPDFLQWLRSSQTGQGEVTCAAVSPLEKLVAMGTSDGQLHVVQCGQVVQELGTPTKCHTNPCSLCFTADGRSLLTVGGSDVCIMQWKVV